MAGLEDNSHWRQKGGRDIALEKGDRDELLSGTEIGEKLH